jgi:Inner membrane protein YgaP-like, transmembrane domain
MNTNVGSIDRIVRAVVALAALAAAVALGVGTVGGLLLLVVGGIMAVTAAVGFCPLYRVFGLSTCPAPKR